MEQTSTVQTCQSLLSDSELLAAVLKRCERAWSELIRRYRGLIYRCIGKVTAKYAAIVDREAMEDIFADVCLNLVRDDMHKLRAYRADRGSKLGSWIGLIAINTAYDYLRGVARQPRLEGLDVVPDMPAGVPSPLDLLCERERWGTLNAFVLDFSDRDRHFLELYYADGKTPEEIADQMGISVKTVYSKKNKVLARLTRLAQLEEASAGRREKATRRSQKRATSDGATARARAATPAARRGRKWLERGIEPLRKTARPSRPETAESTSLPDRALLPAAA